MSIDLIHVAKGYLSSEIQSKKCGICTFSMFCIKMDNSLNMSSTLIKCYLLILKTVLEGIMSKILELVPSFPFMQCRK